MFNIRSLVNRISQVKDGEATETSPNKSRTQSQTSGTSIDDGAVPVEAEGFLCPSCMAAFGSPDDLQKHYQNDHLDPGANYLCPVCKARLNTSNELELHFSANHSTSSIKSGDIETLVKQIGDLTSSLSEERWHSQELRKELESLKEMLQVQGTSDEQKMYHQQLQGLQETKTLLTTEVGLLRKQLTEALGSLIQVKQEKESIETKAAGFSQRVVELQANLDDNNSLVAGLRENIQDLQLQLSQQLNNEDAEAQIKELMSAQILAEDIIAAKDTEIQEIKKNLEEIQSQSAAQKTTGDEKETTLEDSFEEKIKTLETKNQHLESEVEQYTANNQKLEQLLVEKNEQLQSLQHIREETDVCVGRLREEVTSLQEMLNEARHEAEGQVSQKDDELFQLKQDFLKQEKQIVQLEEQCHILKTTNENISRDLVQQRQTIEDGNQAASRMKEDINQLEEKISRLESEKLELLENIQKGEGMIDTAIQQLQQDNERLQEELTKTKGNLVVIEQQAKANSAEWSRTEQNLREERKRLEEKLKELNLILQKSDEKSLNLEDSLKRKNSELKDLQTRFSDSEKTKGELETLIKQKDNQLEECSRQDQLVKKDLQSEKEKKIEQLKINEDLLQELNQRDKQVAELQRECKSLNQVSKNLEHLREELDNSKKAITTLISTKEKLEEQLNQNLLRLESLEKMCKDREGEISSLNLILQESQNRVSQLENLLADKERVVSDQQTHIAELEPLTEALEQEKIRRIKEKAEWGEHEQLLRGEKEALSTLVTHLQQQLDELTKEHQFHLQRLKNEGEILLKEKKALAEKLNYEKESRAKDLEEWKTKGSRLEEETKSLVAKLRTAEDLSAARYQRCEELQASSEKYLSLKLELEAKVSVLEDEKLELQNNCSQWETEVDRLKFNAVELRRRLEDSQAALHELGRENQSLQMENAKLVGRKWADDSEVNDCHTCHKGFNITIRKHHCRNCGQIFCNECSSKSTAVGNSKKPVRVCDSCYKELNVNPSR